ncbi:MAG: tRNA (guanosine(46)-N7)-methyltransferase TrmB [Alphaproteobacteria bacterium]|nr:tRNA (guanosine(46)-N7)-methyltransferase TrmB [Alphaproteobacteria bacterium]
MTETGSRRSDLYGRRTGRPLSGQQEALIGSLLPRLIVSSGSIDLPSLFPGAKNFALEVGFGGGEHLVAQSQAFPSTGFIGCEPFLNGLAKLLSQIDALALKNIRIHTDDARDVLVRLPDQSLSSVFVMFPDPWPKVRHHKRRFFQRQTLDLLARVLRPGGELRLATDHMDYARWALAHLMADVRFRWSARSAADWRVRPEGWPPTRYEQKALIAGRSCVYLAFQRA